MQNLKTYNESKTRCFKPNNQPSYSSFSHHQVKQLINQRINKEYKEVIKDKGDTKDKHINVDPPNFQDTFELLSSQRHMNNRLNMKETSKPKVLSFDEVSNT